ncbi:MAG: transcriptional regulator, partial [Clostridia bacterium]|nr:transcriptional regulator [Clostridia bacterium]
MPGNRSFKDYVAYRFYNELFAAIQSYTADNYTDLNLKLYRVRGIGAIELSDIEVKFVSVNDLPGMKIEFDVVVEAELEVRESDYHYDESESCSQWFVLKCFGDLACNLDDFAISSVAEYTSKHKQPRPMSDSLVPIINKEKLESVATDFLRRHYPE